MTYLRQLQTIEQEIGQLPSGDEKARKAGLIDQVRKEIMVLEAHRAKRKPVSGIEDRIETLFLSLKLQQNE